MGDVNGQFLIFLWTGYKYC